MGSRLQELRQARGLSQSQLARAAGVPVGSLRGWEQARRTMLVDAAAKLADALRVSLDELVGRTPPGAAPTAGGPKRKKGKGKAEGE
jgi:transcriptional regulator with XRE-family HTH domain